MINNKTINRTEVVVVGHEELVVGRVDDQLGHGEVLLHLVLCYFYCFDGCELCLFEVFSWCVFGSTFGVMQASCGRVVSVVQSVVCCYARVRMESCWVGQRCKRARHTHTAK